MSDIRDVTDELLADRPSIEDDLEAIIAVDDRAESWTFDDIPVDSGTFGELVSRGIIEAVGDEYRVADPAAVRAALNNESHPSDSESEPAGMDISVQLPDVDPFIAGTLVGLLAFVVLLRTVAFWPSVFRGSDIVLLGNDPYFYRYWLEELFRTGGSVTSPPPALQDHDIAMIAVMHGVASLLGGGREAVSIVLAWYPVVASVLIGLLVYVMAIGSFGDRRVALASVAVYAVTPLVAFRSALGFGDHHAFDYFLVALAVASLLLLIDERADWRTITQSRLVGFSGFALAVALQVHAWRAGPLLILPLAPYITLRVASDVRAGESPLQANAWTLGALTTAAVLAAIPHFAFEWSGVYRAFAPALLLAGSLVVVGIGELAARREFAAQTVLGLEAIGGIVVGVIGWVTIPDVRRAGEQGIAYFVRTGQTSITETRSVLSPEYSLITTPVFALGLSFVLAVATLVWVMWRVKREHRPTWLALSVYTSVLFLLALVQLRFAGQFGILAAVFAGLGFVYLVAAVDVTERPRPFTTSESETGVSHPRAASSESTAFSFPDRQVVSAVVVIFLLVGGFGTVQTATGAPDLTIDDATYDAAMAIDSHSTTAERTWPDNYVFSDWGRNRVYNYYVNNQSRSYWYAQQYYAEFLFSDNSSGWYDRLSGKPTGYVVVTDIDAEAPPASMQSRLWNHWGSRSNDVEAVGHYRVVYANQERKVYELVPGAMLVGRGEPGETQTVSTEFEAGGETHTYERQVTATANGWYVARVPYAGSYEAGNNSLTVNNSDIERGEFTDDRGSNATWHLDEGRGNVLFDARGGHHANGENLSWRASPDGRSLSLDGTSSAVVANATRLDGEGGFTVSAWFRTNNSTEQFAKIVSHDDSTFYRLTRGYQVGINRGRIFAGLGDGKETTLLGGPQVVDGKWHRVTLVWDGETARLYLDGREVNRKPFDGSLRDGGNFSIGANTRGNNEFVGAIDEVRYEARNLPPGAIRRSYTNSPMSTS